MNLAKFIFLTPIFVACVVNNGKNEPWHSNAYYSIYSGYNEKTHTVDSIIAIDKKGKRSVYALNQNGIGDYPGLYKNRLISLIYGREYTDLITFDLVTHQTDTLFSNLQILEGSAIDEYDGRVVVRDAAKYCIVDVEKKKVLKQSDCNLENILLVDSTYFLIRTLNNYSEPKPYLCRGSIAGTKDNKLIDVPGRAVQRYEDATTYGWNGMAICSGMLFIHSVKGIIAYDIQHNKIVDQMEEQRILTYKVKSGKPTFAFGNEKIVFDLKSNRFKQV